MNVNPEYVDSKSMHVQPQQFSLLGKVFMLASFLFAVVAALIYIIMRYMPDNDSLLPYILIPMIAFFSSGLFIFVMGKKIHRSIWINSSYLLICMINQVVFFGFLFLNRKSSHQ